MTQEVSAQDVLGEATRYVLISLDLENETDEVGVATVVSNGLSKEQTVQLLEETLQSLEENMDEETLQSLEKKIAEEETEEEG